MTLSDRQRAAVTRTGQDVCVVAGPGSGKTRVLVERFAWLVEDRRVSPLRILAITFTEKAATEIRRRLSVKFAADAVLREQVERAPVSTIHGLCARLLRDHPIQAGLDPEFLVLDGPSSNRLLREAAHGALESLYSDRRAEMRRLLDALYVSTREDARQPDTATALIEIYRELRTAGRAVADVRAALDAAPASLSLAQFVEELRGRLSSIPAKLTAKQSEFVASLRDWVRRASAMPPDPVAREHFELLDAYPRTLPRGPGFEGYKELRDERRELVESTFAAAYFRPLKELLLDAIARLDARYRDAKSAAGGLDFSDLEEKAIELLAGDARLLEETRDAFDQILMDELQDTNPLQWRLVDLLRRPERFFAVGDINQSIYGFRYASPDAFVDYRDRVRASGGVVDELADNYRSRPEILAAAGSVLEGASGVEPRGLDARRVFHSASTPPVEVIAAGGDSKDAAEQAEARGVARRIASLAGRLPVEDGRGGRRPLRFRDVAVLVRTTGALPPLEESFREARIPYRTEGGRTFYETREARDLAMLLKLIADPGDGAALAGVLRSPLAGIGDETLLRRKLGADLPDDGDRERLARFEALLDQLRAESEDVPPDMLLARAMDACDYEGGLDARARAGVDRFLAIVRDLDAAHPGSLGRLVEDLEWRRAEASEAEAPPDDSADMVRVMTIHGAKGLEFPVVFLPALHRGSGGDPPAVGLAPQGGLGVHWRNPVTGGGVKDPAFAAALVRRSARETEEEDRLLYVAMTRAEEHLVLSFARTKSPRGHHWSTVEQRLGVTHAAALLEPAELAPPPDGEAVESPRPLAAPPLAGQFDSSVAATSLGLFWRCPRRHFLARELGLEGDADPLNGELDVPLPAPVSGGPSGAEFGTLVHALLAGKPVENAPAEARDQVRRFHESELGVRAARAARVEREFDFAISIEDVVVTGSIDLWFEEGGELVLADYKTDRLDPGEASRRAAAYAWQLRLYELALAGVAGRLPDRALVCFLRSGEVVPVAVEPDVAAGAAELVQAWKTAQEKVDFPMRPGGQCEHCPFRRGLCPAGEPGMD